MYVGDILSTKKFFDLKIFYRFIHNTDSYPSDKESREFLKRYENARKTIILILKIIQL